MGIALVAELPPIHEADGALRIGRSSVALETVLWAFQAGSTPQDIVDQFPSVTLGQVYDVVGYYLRHRDEMDRYLATQRERYQQTTNDLRREAPANGSRTTTRRPPGQ